MSDLEQNLRALTKPLFDQKAEHVFVSMCCRKLYAGVSAPVICRKCKLPPKAIEVTPANLAETAKILEGT